MMVMVMVINNILLLFIPVTCQIEQTELYCHVGAHRERDEIKVIATMYSKELKIK